MDWFTRFRCPVCSGPVALWAIGPLFTCPHCKWALSSNRSSAFMLALGIACLLEALLFAALWLTAASPNGAFSIWLAAGGGLGVGAWFVANRLLLRLSATRPPRGDVE